MTKRTKRLAALFTAVILLASLSVTIGTAFASDSYYPGPDKPTEEPVIIETPSPTKQPAPTPAETTNQPEPTPAPATPEPEPDYTPVPPTPEPEPTPVPVTPEPVFPQPEPEPAPVPEPDHTITIYYKYPDGSPAAVTYVAWLYEGSTFDVYSPVIPGYYFTHDRISGVMGDRDLSYVVYYYYAEQFQILDEYETPLGNGSTVINIGDCFE